MRAAALLLGVLMLTAGCLGFGGDEETEDPEADAGDGVPEDDGSSEDQAGGNETDGSGDHEHQPEPERHWDNKTGEVQGQNVIVDTQGSAEETTEIPEAAQDFQVNLTADGGEIEAEVYPPECEEQDEEPGEDCSTSLTTMESDQEATQPNGGTATWETQDPDAGTWTIRMWKGDAGTDAVPYTLGLSFLEEHEPGPGHHS